MPNLNYPLCRVDIYPFDGGSYTLNSAQVIQVSTTSSVGGDGGKFSITIVPGGPQGVESSPSWTEIITPMSLVVIAMRRGTRAGIPMVGLVMSTKMPQTWQSGQPVQRTITIQGMDFTRYFMLTTYYSLWYLGATGQYPAQNLSGTVTADPTLSNWGTQTPNNIAKNWYNGPMVGAFANTYVTFQGAKVTFKQAVSTVFQDYDNEPGENVFIPFADYLISSEDTWINKLKFTLPFPWYEVFVVTAPSSAYGSSGGYNFTSTLTPGLTVGPTLVCRVNPVPRLNTSAGDQGKPSFDSINTTLWSALTEYTLDDSGFISVQPQYDESEVLNFFTVNPTFNLAQYGQANNSINPAIYQYFSAADATSIERYGYRPANGSISWFTDPNGNNAQQNAAQSNNIPALNADVLGRFAGYYEPVSLMVKTTVTMPLRPDILPGFRFTFTPFKNGKPYTFYINDVSHNYSFGGPSTTTLALTRGLPSSIYAASSSTGTLYALHVGAGSRLDGIYSSSFPATTTGSASQTPLQALDIQDMKNFFANLAMVYTTPQMLQANQP